MKCDELKSLKNIGLSFDTTTLHKQVIAEDSEGKCYGFDSWEEIYLKSDVDAAIAELKDKCLMHDFFWEGCGFAKRGFKNTIAVSEAFDKLEEENAELKEAQSWRKFSEEKPEKWQKVLFRAKYKTDNIRTWIGEFRNVGFDVFYASAPGWGCEFLPNEIFGWMPLPSAPKEEK